MIAADRRSAYGALCESVPAAAAAIDGPWFAATPGRSARARLATADEAELACLRAGWPADPGARLRYLVVVRPGAPLTTSRTFASAEPDRLAALDDDDMALCLFAALSARRGHGRRAPVVRLDERGRPVL